MEGGRGSLADMQTAGPSRRNHTDQVLTVEGGNQLWVPPYAMGKTKPVENLMKNMWMDYHTLETP